MNIEFSCFKMAKPTTCHLCSKVFSSMARLTTHLQKRVCERKKEKLKCGECNVEFSRSDALHRHMKTAHVKNMQIFVCGLCNAYFTSQSAVRTHKASHKMHSRFELIKTSLQRSCEVFRLHFPNEVNTIEEALAFLASPLIKSLPVLQLKKKHFKYSVALHAKYVQSGYTGDIDDAVEGKDTIAITFRSSNIQLTPFEKVVSSVRATFSELQKRSDDFAENGSGWIIEDVYFIDLNIAQCANLAGSCSTHNVKRKKGHTVIENATLEPLNGKRCFFKAIAAHFVHNATEKELELFCKNNFIENITAPVKVNDIVKFEDANAHLDIAVHVVYMDEDCEVFPHKPSKKINAKNQIVIMLHFTMEDSSENKLVLHYSYVENLDIMLSKVMKTQTNNYYRNKSFLCFNCFNTCYSEAALKNHILWCYEETSQALIMPEPNTVLQYEKGHKEFESAYTFFYDFECVQVAQSESCNCENLIGDCKEHNTSVETIQEPIAYTLIILDRAGKVMEHTNYLGDNAGEVFLDNLLIFRDKYFKKLKEGGKKIQMTDNDWKTYWETEKCHICEETVGKDRVRDHNHITGEFIGAAHNICNLHRKECIRLTGFSHNFSGYDSHIITRALAKKGAQLKQLTAIPLNSEKFKCLQFQGINFLDSLAFLPDSLDKLVNTLVESNHKFTIMEQWISDPIKCKMMLKKGLYCYEHVKSVKQLYEEKQLPPRKAFYSKLGNKYVNKDEYNFAQKVWETFECKNMADYTKLYCDCDTFLLAECVTELRNAMYDEFKLDLTHFLSLPHMSKEIWLKLSEAKVNYISDPDMMQFFRGNIRGGLSYINTRYYNVKEQKEKTNNDTSILYVDANNLYGAAMRFPMPTGDYEWITAEELMSIDIAKYNSEGDVGYTLEVDLEYPAHLHMAHNSFPLAPEHMTITEKDLSEYSTEALRQFTGKHKYKENKLTSTFHDRKNYVCHILNLQLYLELGMKLKCIHRGVKFNQSPIIRDYVDLCTQKRATSKTKSRSNMWKLICNSLYGKLIENGQKRVDCKFSFTKEQSRIIHTNPRFQSFMICNEDMTINFLKKKKVHMKQCFAIGFSILDISKYIMQYLYYKVIKPAFINNVSVLMSDTDSFMLAVPSISADNAMIKIDHVSDFSNYPSSHKLFENSRKNCVGLLKNEVPAIPILRFAGSRSKSYAYETEKSNVKTSICKAKGVKRQYQSKISVNSYLNCIKKMSQFKVLQYSIQSKNHVLRLVRSKKIAFSSFDGKRALICPIHSVGYGSKLIDHCKKYKACYFCEYPNILV